MLDSLSHIFYFSSDFVQPTAILSIVFVGRQVEQNANEEVQQYMNNEVDILYFEDRAVVSLNAAQMLFPALIIPSIKCESYFVYFVLYSYKIIPRFGLAVTRLSHIFHRYPCS